MTLTAVLFGLVGIGSVQERAFSQDAPNVTGPAAYDPGHIFVKFEEGAPANAEDRLEDATGAREEDEFSFIDVSVVDLPRDLPVDEAVERYESSPYVEYAEPDYRVELDQIAETDSYEAEPGDVIEPAPEEPAPADPAPDQPIEAPEPEVAPLSPNDPGYGELWGMDNTGGQTVDPDPYDGMPGTPGTPDADIDAPEAWGITTGGPGAVVAVIDSGVDTGHPDLRDNIWTNPDEVPANGIDDDGNGKVDDVHGWDFVNNDGTVYDDEGEYYHHGTHLAGTVAAVGDNGEGVAGVSWGAKVMPLKFVAPGGGYTGQAIEALKYAVTEGADISNHSYNFGGSHNATFEATIRWADERGHLLVVSAGNDAVNTDTSPQYPAGYDSPNVVSVAAADHDDGLWAGSNRGAASVDLAAPGAGILSTVPSGDYGRKTGTSMATAYVSGAAALLESAQPGLTPQQARERAMLGAEKRAGLEGTSATGGRLNVGGMLGIESTAVSLSADPTVLLYGAAPVLRGALTSSGEPLAGKEVVVEKREVGKTGFVPIATATTAVDGAFSYGGSHPSKHTDYRVRFGGERGAGLASSASRTARVDVRVGVTLSVVTGNLRLGRARAVTGYVKPSHAGKSVELTINKLNSPWVIRPDIRLNADSRYVFNFKPNSTGHYTVSARFHGDADHLAGSSPRKDFRVVN